VEPLKAGETAARIAWLGVLWLHLKAPWSDVDSPWIYVGASQAVEKEVNAAMYVLSVSINHSTDPWLKTVFAQLSDVIAQFEVAQMQGWALSAAAQCALAWCYMARAAARNDPDDARRGARIYVGLARRLGSASDESVLADSACVMNPLQEALFRSAIEGFTRAKFFQEALEAARELHRKCPDIMGTWESMARAYAGLGNYQEAYEALAEEFRHNHAYDDDWKATLMIELGSRARPVERIVAAVLSARPGSTRLAEGVLAQHWPTFRSLSNDAKRAWTMGTVLINDPEIRDRLEQPWIPATVEYGKALEIELRSHVFEPFRERFRSTASEAPWRDDKSGLALFVAGAGGPMTLGAMLRILNWSENQHPVVKEFSLWVRKEFPRLNATPSLRAKNVAIRNEAAHAGQVTEEDFREYAEWVHDLLERIHRRR
jgi:tetratricopeptide (TPR) repeat protein